jgi:hypothetical protein
MSEEPNQSESPVTPSSIRRRNHAIWIGPLVVFIGVVSYFTYFTQFPALRDFPWINLPIVLIGCGISIVSTKRAFSRSDVYRGKVLGSLSMIFSTLLTALFVGYIGYLSYQLPEPTKTTQGLSIAPEFVLTDHNGQEVALNDFRGKKLIVTFYRGHW